MKLIYDQSGGLTGFFQYGFDGSDWHYRWTPYTRTKSVGKPERWRLSKAEDAVLFHMAIDPANPPKRATIRSHDIRLVWK